MRVSLDGFPRDTKFGAKPQGGLFKDVTLNPVANCVGVGRGFGFPLQKL